MLNVVVVDDEILGQEMLIRLLGDYRAVSVAAVFDNGGDTLAWFQENTADAAFLDIQMPGISGLELATSLVQLQPSLKIVFVTAYDRFAVEAFRLASLDYLLKPVTDERLKITLDRLAVGKENQDGRSRGGRILIRLLGSFDIQTMPAPGQAASLSITFRLAKAKELLAFLLLSHDQVVTRDYILAELWPDDDPAKAAKALHAATFYLHQTLQELGLSNVFFADKGRYRFCGQEIEIDIEEFSRYFNGRALLPDTSLEEYVVAARLYRGELLADCPYPWADSWREDFAGNFRQGLLAMAEAYSRCKDFPAAEAIARRAIRLDIYHEPAYALLIDSLIAQKNVAGAKKIYLELQALLKADLDIAPSFPFDVK